MKDLIIRRDFYVEKLIRRRMNGFVKVITGVRRCGKSYLLNTLFRQRLKDEGVADDHIISVDLDDKAFMALRDPFLLDDYVRKRVRRGKKPYYVFIDEIQRTRKVPAPGVDLASVSPEDIEDAYVTFYDVLNGWRKLDNVDVYVTGSNSKMLASDVATNFRGRGDEIHVMPLSFSEFASVHGSDSRAWEEYLTYGGMPQVVLERDVRRKERLLADLFAKIYLKDIVERSGYRDDYLLGKAVDVVSSAVGSLTNPHKLVLSMRSTLGVKTTDVTLKGYLDALAASYLYARVDRYDVKGRRHLDYPSKYYAVDTGLRNARLNFREFERAHLMENVIYNELISRGYAVDVGVVKVWATENGKRVRRPHEIDFVVNDGSRRIYIQATFAMTSEDQRNRETLPLRKTGDFFRKIIVTDGYELPHQDADGIVHMGVVPFLLDPKSVEG